MGFRPMFLVDGGEAKELVPLKLLYTIHFFAFSMQTYLPVRTRAVLRSVRATG
jgi:hypothetical protein